MQSAAVAQLWWVWQPLDASHRSPLMHMVSTGMWLHVMPTVHVSIVQLTPSSHCELLVQSGVLPGMHPMTRSQTEFGGAQFEWMA